MHEMPGEAWGMVEGKFFCLCCHQRVLNVRKILRSHAATEEHREALNEWVIDENEKIRPKGLRDAPKGL